MHSLFAFTNALPAIIGIVKYRKLTPDLKAVTWLMICSVMLEIVNKYRAIHYPGINNMFSGHVYTLASFLCFSLVYSYQLSPVISSSKVKIIGLAGCLLCVVNVILFQPLTVYPSYSKSVVELITLLFAVLYLYKLIVTDNRETLWEMPMFWINTGVLLFYAMMFFYNMIFNHLNTPAQKFLLVFRKSFILFHYFTLAIALWVYRRK